MDKLRDELAESGSQNGPYQPYNSDSFKTGWNSAISAMREEAAKEFDEEATTEKAKQVEESSFHYWKKAVIVSNNPTIRPQNPHEYFITGARWQHEKDHALINELKSEIERLKEIEYMFKGLHI